MMDDMIDAREATMAAKALALPQRDGMQAPAQRERAAAAPARGREEREKRREAAAASEAMQRRERPERPACEERQAAATTNPEKRKTCTGRAPMTCCDRLPHEHTGTKWSRKRERSKSIRGPTVARAAGGAWTGAVFLCAAAPEGQLRDSASERSPAHPAQWRGRDQETVEMGEEQKRCHVTAKRESARGEASESGESHMPVCERDAHGSDTVGEVHVRQKGGRM